MRGTSTFLSAAMFASVLAGCAGGPSSTEPGTREPAETKYEAEPVFGAAELELGALTQYTRATNSHYAHPHVSYDGMWMAYSSTVTGSQPQIFIQRKGEAAARQLTHGPSSNIQPQISPDSKYVAFSSNRDGKWRIYVIALDGNGGLEEISDSSAESLNPTWSPDGKKVAFSSRSGAGRAWTICIFDRMNGNMSTLCEGSMPDWSPDGSRIVFQRVSHNKPGYSSLYTIRPDGSESTVIYQNDTHGAITPAWAGTEWVLFSTVNRSMASQDRNNDQMFNADDIWMVKRDGTQARLVTQHRLADWDPCFDHRTHEVVFISNRNNVQNIYGIKTNLRNTMQPGGNLFAGGR